MVIYEEQEGGIIKAYSDAGMMIQGGFPLGMYEEAYDPKELNRTYTETDIPIPSKDEEIDDVMESRGVAKKKRKTSTKKSTTAKKPRTRKKSSAKTI